MKTPTWLQTALLVALIAPGIGCDRNKGKDAPTEASVPVPPGPETTITPPSTSPVPPDSLEARMLADLEQAQRVEVMSLELRDWEKYFAEREYIDYTAGGTKKLTQLELYKTEYARQAADMVIWCGPRPCVDDHRVLVQVAADTPERLALVRRTLQDWASKRPNYAGTCDGQYDRGIAWDAGGMHYDVLLCYSGAMYKIYIDGRDEGLFVAADPTGLEEINALLASAGTAN